MKTFLYIIFCFSLAINILADSGGPLSPQQAAYDVNYYNLKININTTSKTISASLLAKVKIVNVVDVLVLDLINDYTIDSIIINHENNSFQKTTFTHTNGKININFPFTLNINDFVSAIIYYKGTPPVSATPPWTDGFVWRQTPSGKPWIGVACEEGGADIWWPCKDHPSDEPDSMSLSFTVPNPLECVSNGRFVDSINNGDGTTTFNWFVSAPINNYNVTFYAADFNLIQDSYSSVSGKSIPFYFWVLPESYNQAVAYMNVFESEFNFLESVFGPFPFSNDKHGWAHAPYWGMEHQTIIAYGHNFTKNNWGYDYIHYHELAHEWWGNFITAKSWSDVWIHEGVGTYAEALYVEHISGKQTYHQFMNSIRPPNNHSFPLAPREELTANNAFISLNSYHRGASVMHTLRFHLGDSLFFRMLKEILYPDSTDYDNSNGRQNKIYSTDDFKNAAELITNIDLDPFFEVFFREATYPTLQVRRTESNITFKWNSQKGTLLDLDIPINLNGNYVRVEMNKGEGLLNINKTDKVIIDPDKWLLMANPVITDVEKETIVEGYSLNQNYPNPFNPFTTISFQIPQSGLVELKLYDILGNESAVLLNEYKEKGVYSINFDGTSLPSGTYYYRLRSGNYTQTKKLTLLK